jgi:hypothetical protein
MNQKSMIGSLHTKNDFSYGVTTFGTRNIDIRNWLYIAKQLCERGRTNYHTF